MCVTNLVLFVRLFVLLYNYRSQSLIVNAAFSMSENVIHWE